MFGLYPHTIDLFPNSSNSSRITASKSFIMTFASQFIPLNSIAQKGVYQQMVKESILVRIEVVVQIVFFHIFFGGAFPAKKDAICN